MPLCVKTINPAHSTSYVPLVIVLEWESQSRWKNLAVLLFSIPLPLRISVNKQGHKSMKHFPRTKVQHMSQYVIDRVIA